MRDQSVLIRTKYATTDARYPPSSNKERHYSELLRMPPHQHKGIDDVYVSTIDERAVPGPVRVMPLASINREALKPRQSASRA